jgi:hypothetical protein
MRAVKGTQPHPSPRPPIFRSSTAEPSAAKDRLTSAVRGSEWVFHLAATPGSGVGRTSMSIAYLQHYRHASSLLEAGVPNSNAQSLRVRFHRRSTVVTLPAMNCRYVPVLLRRDQTGGQKSTARSTGRFDIKDQVTCVGCSSLRSPPASRCWAYHPVHFQAILQDPAIHLTGDGEPNLRGLTPYISDCVGGGDGAGRRRSR